MTADEIPPLEPPLADLLLRLVRIDKGAYNTFRPAFDPEYGMVFTSHAFEEGEPKIEPGLVRGLADHELVEIDDTPGKILGPFRITPLGRRTAQAAATSATARVHQRERRGEGKAVDTTWGALEPILRAVHDAWVAAGADRPLSGRAVHQTAAPELTEAQLATSLRLLRDGGQLDYFAEVGPTIPNGIKPTQRTIERYGGWPGNTDDQIVQRLLDALDKAIDDTDDPDQKSKIRKAKEAVGDISKSVAAAAIFHAGKTAAGGL